MIHKIMDMKLGTRPVVYFDEAAKLDVRKCVGVKFAPYHREKVLYVLCEQQ